MGKPVVKAENILTLKSLSYIIKYIFQINMK